MPASLVAIYRRFSKETAMLTRTLEASIASSVHTPLTRQQSFVAELCVIRLHDAWSRFCRELVVTSAYAQPMTAQGSRVPRAPGVKRRDQVIPKLLATYQKRTQEPHWYLSEQCLDAARRLKVSNYSAIFSGIGASFPEVSPSPNDQVRLVRNFFAHRHQESAGKALEIARSLNISGVTHPRSLVVATAPPGISVFGLWANRLRLMAYLSIQ